MSKLYLHKISDGKFKTIKDTIIADISKIRNDFRPKYYIYIDNIFHKNPKTFILKGGLSYSNIKFMHFPVERVLIDSDIHTHRLSMHSFTNAKELELSKNVKYVEISNSFGLRNIVNITIPFNIEIFENNYVYNNLKTITIKNNAEKIVLEIDDIFDDVTKDILISNTDNNLKVSITSKYSSVYYDVYFKDNKFEYTKNYKRYEVKPDEDKTLDLIKLKQEYNCKLIPNSKLEKEKVILTKDDYKFLEVIDINLLKELIIKDENEMTLFPRTIEIKENNGLFKEIKVFDNKLLINLETKDKNNRYVLINEDLTYIDLDKKDLNIINKVIFDFDANAFKIKEDNEGSVITIPFNKDFDLNSLKILNHIAFCAKEVYVKNKENEIKIRKLFPRNLEHINLKNIEKDNQRDFILEYKLDYIYLKITYNYDKEKNEYYKTYEQKINNTTELDEIDYKANKILLKK